MSRTIRTKSIFPITVRKLSVAAVRDVTPNIRRITLMGDELKSFETNGVRVPAFVSEGFDDHIKMVFPENGEFVEMGEQREGTFDWTREALVASRNYSVRRFDAEKGEVDVDFVRHGHGPATKWAYSVQQGGEVYVAGPKSSDSTPTVPWHLLIADETALPAVGRWLEEADENTRAVIVVEVPTEADIQRIETRASVEMHWVVREKNVAAGFSDALLTKLRSLDLPEGEPFAWVAGEAVTIAPIRRFLRDELGYPKDHVEVVGYWRRDEARAGEGNAAADMHLVHELSEIVPPVVVRVAATLRIPALIAEGRQTAAEIASVVSADERAVAAVLVAMAAFGLAVRGEDGRYTLTGAGAILVDADVEQYLDLASPAVQRELAVVHLLETIRSGGEAAYRATFGASESERRASDAEFANAVQREACDEYEYLAGPIAQLALVRDAGSIVVAGDGAAQIAHALSNRAVTIVAEPSQRASIEASAAPGASLAFVDASRLGPFPAADVVVILGEIEKLANADAVFLLTNALKAARSSVLLVENVSDAAEEDDHIAQAALTSLAAYGVPMRTSAEFRALAEKAGAADAKTVQIGWGFGRAGIVITPATAS